MMTRSGELETKVASLTDDVLTLQAGQTETNQRLNHLETSLQEFKSEMLKAMGAMNETIGKFAVQVQKRPEMVASGSGGSNLRAPVVDLSPASGDRQSARGNRSEGGESQLIARKVELPAFDGDKPLAWIAKAEQYFEVQETWPADKVAVAMMCMDGAALNWLSWLKQKRPGFSWEELKLELVKRF